MLSDSILAQMRLHMEENGVRVDDANREAYRELARAGIMYPVFTIKRGPEGISGSRILDGISGMRFSLARSRARDRTR